MKESDQKSLGQIVDLSKLFYRALNYWYFIPVFFILSLIIGIYKYKTTIPLYRISTTLMVSAGESSYPVIGTRAEEGSALPGVILGGDQYNLQNQLVVLTSNTQVERSLKQLDFGISYYLDGMFVNYEIYKGAPFKVIIDTTSVRLSYKTFGLEFISPDEFVLTVHGNEDIKERHRFFEKIKNDWFSFSIVPVEANLHDYLNKKYAFEVNRLSDLVGYYKKQIVMEPVGNSSIYQISILENNTQKGMDFLNALAQNSVDYTLDKKNQIAQNTISFIERQLIGVGDSLNSAQKVLEDFRSRNEVMDVSIQGQMIIEQSQELENQRSKIQSRLDYYNYLLDYVENNRNAQEVMFPSSLGLEDPTLTALITEFSTMNAEKSSLLFNSKGANPNIARIENRITQLKNAIVANTKSNIETTNMSLKEFDRRLLNLSSQIRRLPKTEQMLLGIERKFQMSNEMYTYLLEKRSEALLAKAANIPDNEIVEPAHVVGLVQPNLIRIAFLVLFFGIALPLLVIFVLVYYNNKVFDREDVEVVTKHPVLGEIPFNRKANDGRFISYQPRSSLAEAFRSIRTALSFYSANSNNQTYLVTSLIPGEGKSFVAVNVATTHALVGRKTILLGYDLRKPALGVLYNLNDKEVGIVNYYVGKDNKVLNIVKTEIENLDVIFAGETPPNPAELIASDRTRLLFDKLKTMYEVIVIDTPPIGVVSDAYLLAEFSDVNIVVVRHNHTPKSLFGQLMNDDKMSNLKNIAVVVNGMPTSKGAYSSAYAYGKDYYTTG